MKISLAPLSMRQPLQAVGVAALVAGVSACGGTGSTPAPTGTPARSASATQGASATHPTPGTSGSSSPAVVKSQAPVPVESNPPGDIPDNLAFVSYANKSGGYSFTYPEGWAQTGAGTRVLFTDKLNGVVVDSLTASKAPTPSSARSADITRLQRAVPAFELRDVVAVTVPGGQGVRIVFRRNSDPDPVTGKVFRDEVEEYLVYNAGRLVRMDLYGPVGADNVDAYRTMAQSLRLR